MAAKIEIDIGANISDLIEKMKTAEASVRKFADQEYTKKLESAFTNILKPISQLEDELGTLQTAIKNSMNPTDIKRFGDQAERLKSQINNLNVVGLETDLKKVGSAGSLAGGKLGTDLKKGSDRATLALTDLSRIAQDAPFGFIGIQNNINPLIESFGRLKKETGSTGGAFKALFSSLGGAGGFGFAISAISAAVTFATIGFQAWTRGVSSNTKAIEENAKSAEEAKKAYDGIVSSVAKEVGQVEILVAAFEKENLSRKGKQSIIEELQRLQPAYFANLDKEKTTVDQLKLAYDAYVRSISRVIELKVREDQLNKVIEERLALQDKGNKLTNYQLDANGKLQKSYNAVYDGTAISNGFKQLVLTAEETKRLNNLLLTEKQLLADIYNLKQPQDFLKGPDADKTKKDTETIASTLEKLRLKLAEINQEQALLGINADDYKKKISAVLSTATTLVTKFKVSPDSTLISKLLVGDGSNSIAGIESVATTRIKETIRRIRIGLKNELIAAPIDIPIGTSESNFKDYTDAVKAGLILRLQALKIPFNPLDNAEGLQKQLDDAQARLEKFRQDVTDILRNTFQNAAVAVGEGIGKAVAGEGIGSLFSGLFNVIASGIKQLGAYLIKTYTLIAVIKKIKFSNPVVGIAAGVALVALGALISSKINNTKAFANGGFVSGRGTATSDSIPALLSNGEFVLKAAAVQRLGLGNVERLNSGGSVGDVTAGASVGVPYIVSTEISGQNLRLVLKRADASYGRNT